MLLSFSAFTSCKFAAPDADEVAVLVKKPWFFGHGGVSETPIKSGNTWCVITTDIQYFKVVPITKTEEFADMIPRDNTPVSFNAYLKFQIDATKAPILYEKYGKDWYENSIAASFRTLVRDNACKYTMFELASNRTVLSTIEQETYNKIKKYVDDLGIPVTILQVSIGKVTPPNEVLAETKNTAAQNQSRLTQEARAIAELARKQAEINKAIADKSYKAEMGMTIAEYLHLRQIEIEKEKVELIKDNRNVSIIFGSAGVVTTVK